MPLSLFLVLLLGDAPRLERVTVARAETLTVQMAGVGTPVVLLPGLFGGAYGYRNVIPILAGNGYRVLAVEPLALGNSSRPASSDYSLTAQAGRVAAVLDSMHVTDAIVVGHSAGASIAYRLALARPDLVHAIVSLEGGPAEAATTPGFRRAMSLAPFIRLAGSGFLRGRIRSMMRHASGDTTWVTDRTIEGYTAGATADLGATLHAFIGMSHAKEPAPLAPHLREVRCPVTLLLGGAEHDNGPSPAEVDLLRRSLPRFDVVTVPGAGHYLQEERPDAVAGAVERAAGPPVVER